MEHYWLVGGVAGAIALLAAGWWLRKYEIELLREHLSDTRNELAQARKALQAAQGLMDANNSALDALLESDPRVRAERLLSDRVGSDDGSGSSPGAGGDPEAQNEEVEA